MLCLQGVPDIPREPLDEPRAWPAHLRSPPSEGPVTPFLPQTEGRHHHHPARQRGNQSLAAVRSLQ